MCMSHWQLAECLLCLSLLCLRTYAQFYIQFPALIFLMPAHSVVHWKTVCFFLKKKKLFLFSLHKKKIPMKVFSTTTAYPLCSAVCQACQNSAGSPHGMHVCVRTLPWCGQDVGCKMKPTSCPQVCKKKILNLDRRLFVGWMHWLY